MKELFADLMDRPGRHDLLLVLRRIEAAFATMPRIGASVARREEYLKLGQNPFLSFPASTIENATWNQDNTITLLVRFLGLLGPQGAMPMALTEEAHDYLHDPAYHDEALARFLDLFNNRFLQLFFRAWADARPIAQRDRPENDRFEHYVGAFVGVGDDAWRELDSVADAAKAGYAGLLSSTVKSASRLRALIAGLFGIGVEIEEFVGVRLRLPDPAEHSILGGLGNLSLGQDAMIGDTVHSVQDKFRVRIFVADIQQYEQFLPTGDLARQLHDIVRFYVGPAMEYDVELALPAPKAQPVQLGVAGRIGWTGWLSPGDANPDEWRTDARFDLDQRFRANELGPRTIGTEI